MLLVGRWVIEALKSAEAVKKNGKGSKHHNEYIVGNLGSLLCSLNHPVSEPLQP